MQIKIKAENINVEIANEGKNILSFNTPSYNLFLDAEGLTRAFGELTKLIESFTPKNRSFGAEE